jgi:hypothetical protein
MFAGMYSRAVELLNAYVDSNPYDGITRLLRTCTRCVLMETNRRYVRRYEASLAPEKNLLLRKFQRLRKTTTMIVKTTLSATDTMPWGADIFSIYDDDIGDDEEDQDANSDDDERSSVADLNSSVTSGGRAAHHALLSRSFDIPEDPGTGPLNMPSGQSTARQSVVSTSTVRNAAGRVSGMRRRAIISCRPGHPGLAHNTSNISLTARTRAAPPNSHAVRCPRFSCLRLQAARESRRNTEAAIRICSGWRRRGDIFSDEAGSRATGSPALTASAPRRHSLTNNNSSTSSKPPVRSPSISGDNANGDGIHPSERRYRRLVSEQRRRVAAVANEALGTVMPAMYGGRELGGGLVAGHFGDDDDETDDEDEGSSTSLGSHFTASPVNRERRVPDGKDFPRPSSPTTACTFAQTS